MLKIKKIKPDFFDKLTLGKVSWGELKSRKALREYLLQEQERVCGYCEAKLKEESFHIDHFKTRNIFPNLTFEYQNLFLSCNSRLNCANYKDSYGLKKSDFKTIYSPIDIDLDEFEYSFTGEILGKSSKAKKTIEVFNLNSKSLIQKRKRIVEGIKPFLDDNLEYNLAEIFGEFITLLDFLQKYKG